METNLPLQKYTHIHTIESITIAFASIAQNFCVRHAIATQTTDDWLCSDLVFESQTIRGIFSSAIHIDSRYSLEQRKR